MIKNWEDKIVVIAEDEQINYLFLKAVLKPTKAQIIWTKTGRETIEVCTTRKTDIVLMDIKMPDLNGLEATIEITVKMVSAVPGFISGFLCRLMRRSPSGYKLATKC